MLIALTLSVMEVDCFSVVAEVFIKMADILFDSLCVDIAPDNDPRLLIISFDGNIFANISVPTMTTSSFSSMFELVQISCEPFSETRSLEPVPLIKYIAGEPIWLVYSTLFQTKTLSPFFDFSDCNIW